MAALKAAFAVFSIPLISTLTAEFVFKGDISFPARDSVLSETSASPSVNTLTYCAEQCLHLPQCKAIEICPQDNSVVCRLCNYTNPKYTSNTTDVCHHLKRVTESDNCSLEKCDSKDLSETVAFAAFISKTLKVNQTTYMDVVFDEVDFNAGNSYNAQDGFFTAPSDGLFVFTWAFMVERNNIFDSYLQVNGKFMQRSNCNNLEGTGNLPCSSTTPYILKKGDRVNIRKLNGNEVLGEKWSSFKGWKVY